MNTMTRWNPFRDFDDLFVNLSALPVRDCRSSARSGWLPPVDISETADAYQLAMELPAVAIEDISVQVKDGVLSVSGERQQNIAGDGVSPRRMERRHGTFSRSFRLPEDVNVEAISAKATDGVLTLTIAKREEVTPRRIEVQAH